MTTKLLRHIDRLVTMDEARRVIEDGWVLIREHVIDSLGSAGSEPVEADEVLDLTGHVVLPGLINTHHHLFQGILKNVPSLQDVSLFRWLRDIYLLESEFTDEMLSAGYKLGIAELLLSGCTTTIDHHYFRANDMRFDTCVEAASEMGIRFHLARGSFSIGQSQGGLPPDHLVEDEDEILADCERLIRCYHDPRPGAMTRIDLAPCSPYSVSQRLMQESIALARRYGVGSHSHVAQAPEDETYCLTTFGRRSVAVAAEAGWLGPDVWYAHAVTVNDDEIRLMAETGTAVSHCPNSNMYTCAGFAPVTAMLKAGVTVGLGVDGSAANNSSNMLHEVRSALLLQRVRFGADACSPTQALEIATLGGAKLLRREELGVLAPGKAADLIAVDVRRLPFAGGSTDPVAGLVLCDNGRVNFSMVNGRMVVANGRLVGVDLDELILEGNRLAREIVRRTELRYGITLGTRDWRRAYPYEALA